MENNPPLNLTATAFAYLVVLQMVALEWNGERQNDGKIREDAQYAIGQRFRVSKGQVMWNLMDCCNEAIFQRLLLMENKLQQKYRQLNDKKKNT